MGNETLSTYTYKPGELKNLHILGRSPTQDGSLVMFWTASGIEAKTAAYEIRAELEADYSTLEPWVSVWVNGAFISRFMVEKGRRTYSLFRTLTTAAPYTIRLLKESQAMSGDETHSLILHSISATSALDKDEVFLPVEKAEHRIRRRQPDDRRGTCWCAGRDGLDSRVDVRPLRLRAHDGGYAGGRLPLSFAERLGRGLLLGQRQGLRHAELLRGRLRTCQG